MRQISNEGVRRPLMYALIAIFTIALALPLAIITGQSQPGGFFDECYERCGGAPVIAGLPE